MQKEEYQRESECEEIEDYGPEGYHPVYLGERFNGEYQVIQKLGWGHFSTVWLAQSLSKKDEYFALKIQRSKDTHAQTALDQLNLLKTLMSHEKDPGWQAQLSSKFLLPFQGIDMANTYRPLLLIDNFAHFGMHGKHYCSLFQLMGPNLLELIQHYQFKDIHMPLWLVKRITIDVLVGLVYMHEYCRMIHTDIKPENIMVKLPLGLQERLVESLKGYTKKPISMKYLSQLQRKNSDKNRKKYEKKKLKKKAAKEAAKEGEDKDEKEDLAEDRIQLSEDLSSQNNDTNQQPQVAETSAEGPRKMETEDLSDVNPSLEVKMIQDSANILQWKKLSIDIDEKLHFKIADFGNATMSVKHFTDEIQTREYRAPEVIVGLQYQDNTDIWSLACMIYQMATNTFLFKPKTKGNISKDEDHLFKMIELLGPMPKLLTTEGKHSRTLFNKKGDLMNGNPSEFLSIAQLLHEDFNYPVEVAADIEDFLKPMLQYNPAKRVGARQCLHSKWLWS